MKRIKRQAGFALMLSSALAVAACTPSGSTPPSSVGEGEGEGEGEFTPSPSASALTLPYDAAPSPDGATFYFTALGSDGESHALWRVPADASVSPVEMATGFAAPISVAVSADGETVYVADAGHDTADAGDLDDDDGAIGALFSVPAAGGDKAEVPGTYGLRVRGVEAWGTSMLVTGTDPADGQPGVFELDDAGTLSVIAKGAPFSDPSGIAAEIEGDAIYVIDTSGAEDGRGVVLKIEAGAVTRLSAGLEVGMPAGTALSLDERALFVSGLIDGAEGRQAAVHVVDVATGTHVTTTDGLEGNDEAGGLHRARDTGTFAWAGTSTVYRITFE